MAAIQPFALAILMVVLLIVEVVLCMAAMHILIDYFVYEIVLQSRYRHRLFAYLPEIGLATEVLSWIVSVFVAYKTFQFLGAI